MWLVQGLQGPDFPREIWCPQFTTACRVLWRSLEPSGEMTLGTGFAVRRMTAFVLDPESVTMPILHGKG